MSLFLDIAQGAGLACASGVRPFLPPILAGALARADLGVDFEGTAYAFLEAPVFLAAVLALAVLAYAIERVRTPPEEEGADPVIGVVIPAAALALGALLFAGSLAAGGRVAWPGLPAGAVLALLGVVATAGLLARVRRRLDRPAAALLPVWADGAALVLAALSIAFPPVALLGVVGLAYLLVSARRGQTRKYAGLRVLR